MTNNFFLDWLALAVSLHNTMLLLWLGLTVLLNADRRTWGIAATGLSLIFASAFFFSHSAILGLGLNLQDEGLDFWWHLGWIPVIASPFGWYAVILWYSGYWDKRTSGLYRRHRAWFVVAALLTLGLIILLLFTNSLPSFSEILSLQYPRAFQFGGIPVLLLAYLADIFLCVLLSLDAIARPRPSSRVMNAPGRTRPWLVSAAIVLLCVGLIVAGVIFWITTSASLQADSVFMLIVGALDLVIALLIGISILLIGQAIALYEVFTGKALPRRGLVRRWHNAVILAVGFSFVAALSLALKPHPIYNLFVATALVTIFYALYAWRSYVERDRSIRDLRPFVTSQHLYDSLLSGAPAEPDAQKLFRALCRDLLNARCAYLVALGPLAPLVPSLAYPDAAATIPKLPPARFDSPQTICVPLDPAEYSGAHWAVSLWSERGLSGVLMLGEKNDGGLYAQEEIEIARASGERLIDVIASAELSRRLMALQRERIAETQLLDRRARRVLHDEILPQLHAAMLAPNQANGLLSAAHRQISDLLRELPPASPSDVSRLGWVAALRGAVDEMGELFNAVRWEIAPAAEGQLRVLAPMISETLFFAAREAIRNAARHSRGQHLAVRIALEQKFIDKIEDDGFGLDGHGGGAQSGAGRGLALHSAMMAVIGGTLSLEQREGGGTRVTIVLP